MHAALQNYMVSSGTDILQIFNLIDTDGSQGLGPRELLEGLKRLQIRDADIGDAECLLEVLD